MGGKSMTVTKTTTKTTITVKADFIGYHCWPEAPDEVFFLRNIHRHKFIVEVEFPVSFDRQLEFFIVQSKLKIALTIDFGQNASCEVVASSILHYFLEEGYKPTVVSVSEDGENKSTVYVVA